MKVVELIGGPLDGELSIVDDDVPILSIICRHRRVLESVPGGEEHMPHFATLYAGYGRHPDDTYHFLGMDT